MEIDRDAPAFATGEVQVAADPQVVFDVLATIAEWPSWNPDVRWVKIDAPVAPGTGFRWKSGGTTLRSVLRVVDAPREIGWTGTTMGIRAVHVFRFEREDGGTHVRSEESWDGLLARVLRSSSRRTIAKAIDGVLARLKIEAERRAARGAG